MAYDITKKSSFDSIPRWLDDVKRYAGASILQILVGMDIGVHKFDTQTIQSNRPAYNHGSALNYDSVIIFTAAVVTSLLSNESLMIILKKPSLKLICNPNSKPCCGFVYTSTQFCKCNSP